MHISLIQSRVQEHLDMLTEVWLNFGSVSVQGVFQWPQDCIPTIVIISQIWDHVGYGQQGRDLQKKKVHILHIATMLLAQTILMLHSLSVSQIKT